MTKTIITAAVAAIFVLTVAPATFAANPSENATFKVSTAGLDLRIQRDAQSMLRRIEAAASAVCGGAPYIGDLNATHEYKVCVSQNTGLAVARLGSPEVAAVDHQPMATETANRDR